MSNRFKKGDSVQLKVGGPVMAVLEQFSSGNYRCGWFAGKKFETGVFPDEVLEPAPTDDKK